MNNERKGFLGMLNGLTDMLNAKRDSDRENHSVLSGKADEIRSSIDNLVEDNTRKINANEARIRSLRQEGVINENTPPFMQNHLDENPEITEKVHQEMESRKGAVSTEEEEAPVVVTGPTKILDKSKIKNMAPNLKLSVFGQDTVIDSVSSVLKVAAVGLKVNANQPAGRYFFAGPSGVGKTELAERLAEQLGVPILVINMGEYGQEQNISKLIGADPGLVGYKEGGLLTNFVRQNPACVVLFDEIEKADPSMNKIFLSILDKGVCKDNHGRTVEFKETIIIATSNLGAEVEYETELSQEEKDTYRHEVIKNTLPPEIINRWDKFFHFNALSHDIYRKVVNKFITKVSDTFEATNSFALKFSDKLVDFIVNKSYDPAMGGRPASRFLEQVVLPPLADYMLDDDFEKAAKELNALVLDLNKKDNICFKGKNNKILGTLENTAQLVSDIENGQFSKKKTAGMKM
jgi:ATP-dependent Clp protease ATP-binding subunit ClpA